MSTGKELRTLVRPDGSFVGTPAALAALARGDSNVLLSRPQTLPDGRQVVHVRLVPPGELRLPGPATRPGVPAVLVIGVGAALGVAVAVLVAIAALAWVAAHLAQIVGVALLVLAIVYLAGAAVTRCPGLHCAGCRH